MRSYSILLPNEKAKTYRYLTLFILLINCLVFAFVFFNAVDKNPARTSLSGAILCLICLIFFILDLSKGTIAYSRTGVLFIVLGIYWFILGNYLLGSCMLLFALIGFYATKEIIIYFSEAGVKYPSFPPKLFSWPEVEQVILKDDMLTIDLKNNKLFQLPVDMKLNAGLDEMQFNLFCKSLMV